MRRRRRTENGSRGRDASGCGSLMYYLDAHEESRGESDAGSRSCALVHNVVGTARITVTPGPLDLRLVNTLLPNSCFVKKKFAAITVRLREPTCTILLFGSGKCVLTGCRDFVSCIRAVYDVLDMLRKSMHGVHLAWRQFKCRTSSDTQILSCKDSTSTLDDSMQTTTLSARSSGACFRSV